MKRFNFLTILTILLLPLALFGADGGIMVYLQDSWKTIVGVALIMFGAFWVPGLRTLMVLGLKTLVSEAVLKKIFVALAEKLVASTKTKIDDIWLAELKKNL